MAPPISKAHCVVQSDGFEYTFTQMVYLLHSPSKVYKQPLGGTRRKTSGAATIPLSRCYCVYSCRSVDFLGMALGGEDVSTC